MRNVFCKAEEPKDTIRAFSRRLHEKFGIPKESIKVIDEKNDIECGYYHIHFCKEREWEILSTTRPGSGYLTVPYNRLLLSKNGVAPEDCKLNTLMELVFKSCDLSDNINPAESFEAVEKPGMVLDTTIANPDNSQNSEIYRDIPDNGKKKVQFNI